jgi:hypothetical protein
MQCAISRPRNPKNCFSLKFVGLKPWETLEKGLLDVDLTNQTTYRLQYKENVVIFCFEHGGEIAKTSDCRSCIVKQRWRHSCRRFVCGCFCDKLDHSDINPQESRGAGRTRTAQSGYDHSASGSRADSPDQGSSQGCAQAQLMPQIEYLYRCEPC